MTDEKKISTFGMNCPKPLIETRKALKKMESGQILVVEGDHAISRADIPQAMKDTGDTVLSIDDDGNKWTIKIRKV